MNFVQNVHEKEDLYFIVLKLQNYLMIIKNVDIYMYCLYYSLNKKKKKKKKNIGEKEIERKNKYWLGRDKKTQPLQVS